MTFFNYEQWDAVADSYIPILFLISLVVVAVLARQRGRATLKRYLLYFGLSLTTCYGLMFIDKSLGIWPRVGLDYSTHTALALVFAVFICKEREVWSGLAVSASFVAYAALMVYQHYHSIADIATTAVAVLPCYWLAHAVAKARTASDDIAISKPSELSD